MKNKRLKKWGVRLEYKKPGRGKCHDRGFVLYGKEVLDRTSGFIQGYKPDEKDELCVYMLHVV